MAKEDSIMTIMDDGNAKNLSTTTITPSQKTAVGPYGPSLESFGVLRLQLTSPAVALPGASETVEVGEDLEVAAKRAVREELRMWARVFSSFFGS